MTERLIKKNSGSYAKALCGACVNSNGVLLLISPVTACCSCGMSLAAAGHGDEPFTKLKQNKITPLPNTGFLSNRSFFLKKQKLLWSGARETKEKSVKRAVRHDLTEVFRSSGCFQSPEPPANRQYPVICSGVCGSFMSNVWENPF